MTPSKSEVYPSRRFRSTIAWISIVILILILVGLLTHPATVDNHAVWKSSPYGEPRDTGKVIATKDSASQFRTSEFRR